MNQNFEQLLPYFPEKLKTALCKLSATVKENTDEIRLRCARPLALTVMGETVFVLPDGQTSFSYTPAVLTTSAEETEACFRNLCHSSAFAHLQELKNGYLKLENGCRAGICGTVSAEGKLRDITGINIRLSRQVNGCANRLVKGYAGESWLIAGPPGSGKTTLLRDFVRQISSGNTGRIYRTALIDSRGELDGGSCDTGKACDVLNIPNKAQGIEMAVRTLFPQVIAFDEIGTTAELNGVKESFFCGVSVITTAHGGSVEELLRRPVTSELLKCGMIDRVALLPALRGSEAKIYDTGELLRANAV